LNTDIRNNLDGAKRERWVRSAKAYSTKFLEEKRIACERYVSIAAAASAANAINPIPGADIAVDLSVLVKLFSEIREAYGLNDGFLEKLKQSAIPVVARLSNNVVQYAAKEGILLLIKNTLSRQAVKAASKYIPIIGQVIAAGLGYGITSNIGNYYLDECHELARQILENKLEA